MKNSLTEGHKNKYIDLLINRSDVYAVQLEDGRYDKRTAILTQEIMFGEETIGLYQLNLDNQVKWAVVDFDIVKEKSKSDPNFNFDDWKEILKDQVLKASSILKEMEVPHYLEFSGFRGYHIWIFFSKLVEAKKVKPWMEDISERIPQVNEFIEWELFPKQSEIEKERFGSLVKAPLQKHLLSGKYSSFVDENFESIEGLPDIKTYDPAQITYGQEKEVRTTKAKLKHAPEGFNANEVDNDKDAGNNKFPVADNIKKMISKCPQVKSLIEKAEKENHLLNDERVIIASLGRFYGKEGIDWIHSVMKNCSDYNEELTQYYITKHNKRPVRCETIKEIQNNDKCKGCNCWWVTPLGYGYSSIQQHYVASKELLRENKLPDLFEKLGLSFTKTSNHYNVEFSEGNFLISKTKGRWCRIFNIIDFVRFVRPDDWEIFLFNNFPEVNLDSFAKERTDKDINQIFEFTGEEVKYNTYLSEADAKIEKILSDEDNYNIISDTGSGKTESIIKKLVEKKLKAVFLTPYESNSKQLKEKYSIPAVYGDIKQEDVKTAIKSHNLIASTYDGLRKVLNSQISPEEFILIIDEAHNLVTHSNFRGYALSNITSSMTDFKKVINITGTPEGVLNNDYKNVRFVRNSPKQVIENYTILPVKEMKVDTCIEHIINNPVKGKVVVFRNSINNLEVIKEALMGKGIKEEEIQILNSREKEGDLYTSIIQEEKVPEKVKYVLTTSVISDGVNIINENIDSVYMLQCDNLLLLRQFLARFRKGIKNVYDIIPMSETDTKPKKWFDYPVELIRQKSLYEKIAEAKSVFLRDCGLIKNYGKTNLLKKTFKGLSHEINFLRINRETEEVEVNHQLLTLDLLNDFNQVAYLNPGKRKEYIEFFLKIKVNVEVPAEASDQTKEARKKVKKYSKERAKSIIKLLESNPSNTVTAYLEKVNINLLKKVNLALDGLYSQYLPVDKFFSDNKALLKSKEADRLIQKYILFYKYKFGPDLIIELLKKSKKALEEFELSFYAQINMYLIRNHWEILKYNKKSPEIFYFAVFKSLYDFFQSSLEFQYKDLLERLNKYLLEERITKERLDMTKLEKILNSMIIKKGKKKREGDKVTTEGWVLVRLKEIKDLVEDEKHIKTIEESLKAYTRSKLDFMNLNLFVKSLEAGYKGNSELSGLVKNSLAALELKEV